MYQDDTTNTKNNQELKILSDKDKSGKERPWKDNQIKKIPLEKSYNRIGFDNKAFRVKNCSRQLIFKIHPDTGKKKLHSMISCQVRLCPMCNWRRSLKIYSQVSKVMDEALKEKEYRFLFLTLTCKNVEGEKLSEAINRLFHAYKKMTERKIFKKAAKGWFRALEITHDVNEFITRDMYYGNKKRHIKSRKKYYDARDLSIGDRNPNFDLYHPHFHVVLMVNKSYFDDNRLYIKQSQWTSLWKSCLKVDYDPRIDIRAFKTNTKTETSKSIAESAKYTVKDNDYLISGNEELTDKTVATLDSSLSRRRLIAFGGELRRIHKKLNLDDPIDGDLKNLDNEDDDIREDINYMIEVYNWNVGISNYIKIEV
jgi:plasmid rolling circle replication initiator protein Rep